MFKSKRELPDYRMPAVEEFTLWGAQELTYEELLAVNGGKRKEADREKVFSEESASSGGSVYTPPAQNQEPSAPSSPSAQGLSSPNTGGMPSVPQKPDVQAPAESEPKKGWGEKISGWFKENKMIVGKIADAFFKNDGAKTIHMIGGAASGTVRWYRVLQEQVSI